MRMLAATASSTPATIILTINGLYFRMLSSTCFAAWTASSEVEDRRAGFGSVPGHSSGTSVRDRVRLPVNASIMRSPVLSSLRNIRHSGRSISSRGFLP
jgi:hypothetical protein